MPLPAPTWRPVGVRVRPDDADTLREFLDLAENTAGTVDGTYATDQPCPGQDVHDKNGPGPYTPSEKLKAFLRVKHRVCIFPGCQRPSRRCHLDHTQHHPEGPTCSCNMAPVCEHHHLLKHHAPGWKLTNHGDDPAPPAGSPPADDPPF